MVSSDNVDGVGSSLTPPTDKYKINSHVSLQVSTSRKGLLSDERSPKDFPGDAPTLSTRLKLLKLSSHGSEASQSAGVGDVFPDNPRGFHERLRSMLSRRVDWPSVSQTCKEWIKKPLNMVLLLWVICVAVSGGILFLVMTRMLNHSLPRKAQRDKWFEVNNQIINALFTLMCLYLHPKRFYYLVLLCKWSPDDISHLRKVYCKNGTCKPNERAHMMVVVILLHINCFAQYALCGLNWVYKRSDRPIIGVVICLLVAIFAPAMAGLYTMHCPLGKDYECDDDEEKVDHDGMKSSEKRFSLASREKQGIVESRPEWSGGLFHLWEDLSVAYFSICCCFCVFGWNMERLGLGNMYVHIATFVLFCSAPFMIFNLAAVNIENDTIREILSVTGIALCLFGLLYGGFWRIQMRKRFNLKPNNICFNKPDVADCFQWLFCCWCSLAQEVRTGDAYDIVEDRFLRKQLGSEHEGHTPLAPLPREGSVTGRSTADLTSSVWVNSGLSKTKPSFSMNAIMAPPTPLTMRIKDEIPGETCKEHEVVV